jgi:DNA invertase Pin-like site-specific DNA recombinase
MFKDFFEPKNKNVWSIEMGDNLTTHPELRQFKSIISDMEVRNIRSRTIHGFEFASKDGYWIGKAPIGYRTKSIGKSYKDRKILVPEDEIHSGVKEFELVNTIFMYASRGETHSNISKSIGIPRTTIITILQNPVYYGYRKLSKMEMEKDESGLITSSNRKEWWVKHNYEIIVKQEYLDVCWIRYNIKSLVEL